MTGCADPPTVSNSRVSISYVRTIKVATYECKEEQGYVGSGNNTVACLEGLGYETWTPIKFSCNSKLTDLNDIDMYSFMSSRSCSST